MNANPSKDVSSIYYKEIETWFHRVEPPYTLDDVSTFNRLYGQAYRHLDQEHKRLVEHEIVEDLILGVADPQLKAKIFGVC